MRLLQLLLIVMVTTACSTNGRNSEIQVIANTILGEARGEGEHGMKLVADVIHSRVKSKAYPNSPGDVVRQPFQFYGSAYRCPNWETKEAQYAKKLAKELVSGKDPLPNTEYTHFWSGTKLPNWAKGSIPFQFRNHKFIHIK
jgi:spore germination cell wall hydrolase CwlJ-like protein